MKNIKALLFDMDGVVTDTEKQYDEFLLQFRNEYQLDLDFIQKIKGMTLINIAENFLSHLPKEEIKKISERILHFELYEMKYIPVPGVLEFLESVKKEGYKVGLVTSSVLPKVKIALKQLKLETFFEAVVTADDVRKGKPFPECYLKGAEKLKVFPQECIVLEDSFAGIEAATQAGMRVIGVSTTNSEESLQGKVSKVIPDFVNMKVKDIL